jgi:dolichol-phosphate mannosyltransferase
MRLAAYLVAFIQIALLFRFVRRLFLSIHRESIPPGPAQKSDAIVSVVLPVLDEESRVRECLESLIEQGSEVREILVVDGGSIDHTRDIVCTLAARDERIRLIDASPIPEHWNGKAWGLQVGLASASIDADWVLTVDADVRVHRGAVSRTVKYAEDHKIPVLSVAISQQARSTLLSMIHPSLLSTLVYRFGIPGGQARDVSSVQANGQFALYRRDVLVRTGGFEIARTSICEDVTIARHLYLSGYEVSFVEGEKIADAEMYPDALDCVKNWPRSLALRDRFVPMAGFDGLANILFLQVIPLAYMLWVPSSVERDVFLRTVNRVLIGTRIGILFGMRRAYTRVRWTYWLSPLADPVTLTVYVWHLAKRRHVWRGRELKTGEGET